MSKIVTKYIENKAKKVAKGRIAEVINPQQQFIHDPHIRLAQAEALKKQKKHWFKKPHNSPSIILNERDRQILHSVKKRATFLDKGCECCCFTFGFDFIIGFIPVIGDFIGLLLGLELVKKATQADIPTYIQVQMISNVFADFLIGLVPIIGDFCDAIVKSNWRNYMLFEDYIMLRRRDEILREQERADEQRITVLPDDYSESTTQLIDPHNMSSTSTSTALPALHHHQHPQHHPTNNIGYETVVLEVDEENDPSHNNKKENKYGTFFKF
ncbi:hypothetical protein BJ944DRAFT_271784 [Cunninghamella echinulata]|nr:hypothetical protein BJ944DRAFT_271784 [Cunninghamella echinulata]